MTIKLIASAFAISAAISGAAFAQGTQEPTTQPPVVPAPELPAAVGPSVPATNLLIVGSAMMAAIGILASDDSGGTTSTPSTPSTN